jgi:hypothetical protein
VSTKAGQHTTRSRGRRHGLTLLLLSACAKQGAPPSPEPAQHEPVQLYPGAHVSLKLSQADQASLDKLNGELAQLATLTPSQLLSEHAIQYTQTLAYDPRAAKNIDLIQASELKLNEAELAKLSSQGFVITPRNAFPQMLYGYQTIYAADLPVYISLDSILDAVHVSYDRILSALEENQLSADLRTLLTSARPHLTDDGIDATVAKDLDVYFTVALALLEPTAVAPQFPENSDAVSSIVNLASATEGDAFQDVTLFGVRRTIDASQFQPRGHYVNSPGLSRYFRALMWLGRTDFRIIEPLPNGGTVFRRRQLEAVVALTSVVQGEAREAFDRLDQAITAFVGEHDSMQLSQADQLLADLGPGGLAAHSDREVAQLIVDKGYGMQRIASQVIFKESASDKPLPLGSSFALLGQRYVVDSHVFSNVAFDRVPITPAGKRRGLPNPLDVAYAAFDNPAALPLLSAELTDFAYAPQLERIHTLVDAHESAYWDENLYNLWLSALRAVSPKEGMQTPSADGRPAVTGSEAWNRRLLNTQLASWALLRRDSILYVKHSYTTGGICEFPDGYVDPYPEAFARLEAFAMKGQSVASLFAAPAADSIRTYFEHLAQVSALLRTMAESEQTGMPFSAEQLAFLNDAVRVQVSGGCGGGPSTFTGWYTRLLFGPQGEIDPAIADVHTDPDEGVPHILHVATGLPRMMVVTRESCTGASAYVGLAFAYHEIIHDNERLTDQEWARLAWTAPDVAFMKPILP